MKKVLFISFLLLQFGVNAQQDTPWSFGIEFSIDNLSVSSDSDGMDNILMEGGNAYEIEFDQNNYSLGLKTNYYFTEKLMLSFGILYANKDFTGAYHACFLCNIPSTPLLEIIEQRFLVVPVSFNYSLLTGKLKPTLTGGLKNNFEVKNTIRIKSKGYFLEAFVGGSLYYDFLENFGAGIGYKYQAAITSLYKADKFKLRTNSFFLKINYHIK
ncbi:Outer membrane protein beta-barrel domain-containing protein [Salegentibacter echinorum]|uniref:Outer membrane protein beta-barrel domain-containing protein n=1 Tax=Salegentibacter echinorum TaxID=1073325 RepID=A0A1M5FSV4_SALEC|nr:outer membrane beta-barrel protein [Salegentibacter echinorum]SHF94573.1 Outer membrane protein beta-barrel domain-containing protein [Salegentibacter echinorum]